MKIKNIINRIKINNSVLNRNISTYRIAVTIDSMGMLVKSIKRTDSKDRLEKLFKEIDSRIMDLYYSLSLIPDFCNEGEVNINPQVILTSPSLQNKGLEVNENRSFMSNFLNEDKVNQIVNEHFLNLKESKFNQIVHEYFCNEGEVNINPQLINQMVNEYLSIMPEPDFLNEDKVNNIKSIRFIINKYIEITALLIDKMKALVSGNSEDSLKLKKFKELIFLIFTFDSYVEAYVTIMFDVGMV